MLFAQAASPLHAAFPIGAVSVTAAVSMLLIGGLMRWLGQRQRTQLLAQAEEEKQTLQAQHQTEAAAAARKLEQAEQTRAAQEASFLQLQSEAEKREATLREELATTHTNLEMTQADLVATRKIADELPATRLRIQDLETVLTARQGRVEALEEALQALKTRATDLEAKCQEEQTAREAALAAAAEREADFREQLAKHDQSQAEGHHRESETLNELDALRNKHQLYQEQSEKRLASLQRQLSAAEARADLVQKEFNQALGLTATPRAGNAETPPAAGDPRQLRALEDQVKQLEADARKRTREDGYKIAELEFKLSEATERAEAAERKANAAAIPDAPEPEVPTQEEPEATPESPAAEPAPTNPEPPADEP
ncbi:MAG: hypothetical protein KDK99_15320, partial [Verrucomicrobiales bacterium]|nr:hypothetical protein [Verrucomicrobiales bacterium]